MTKEYINDVNKNYTICIYLNKITNIIFILSILLSTIICFKYMEFISIILIVIHILYFIVNTANDILFINIAEDERRKTLLSNAFNVDLSDKKTNGYYNNKEKSPLKKLFVNSFESIYFTNNNLRKSFIYKSIETVFEIIMWVTLIIILNDKNITLLITQCLFSTEIFEKYLKHIYYFVKTNTLYKNFYRDLITTKYDTGKDAILLEYCFEYETLKSYCHFLLPQSTFDKYNSKWTSDWKKLYKKI